MRPHRSWNQPAHVPTVGWLHLFRNVSKYAISGMIDDRVSLFGSVSELQRQPELQNRHFFDGSRTRDLYAGQGILFFQNRKDYIFIDIFFLDV